MEDIEFKKDPAEAKKDKIFLWIFFGLLAAVVLITYLKYFVFRNYYIQTQIDCDPAAEACFVSECDPADDPECPENPDERISYHELIRKKAYMIPLCDPASPDCPPLACDNDESCQIILCDDETKVEEEVECNDPVKYNEENPASEEDEGDSENADEETCEGDDCGEAVDDGGDVEEGESLSVDSQSPEAPQE